jgi:hypothetical protein
VIAEDDIRQELAADLLLANASLQRELAADLRDCIDYARQAGLTWRDIGKALGMDHSSVFRYRKAGEPISVVRGYQTPKSPER